MLRIPSNGESLAAVLDGVIGPAMVIACHGLLSNKGGDKHLMLAKELEGHALPVCRFDFTGVGESTGDFDGITYTREMRDVLAVVDYFARCGVQRFGLYGSSMGGAVALLAAAREERVVAVATLAAVGHTDDLEDREPDKCRAWAAGQPVATEDGRVIGPAFYHDAMQHSVTSAVGILRIPLLVLHGEADEVVPPFHAHDIAGAARRVELSMVDGADHRFTNPVHLRPAMKLLAGFFARELG